MIDRDSDGQGDTTQYNLLEQAISSFIQTDTKELGATTTEGEHVDMVEHELGKLIGAEGLLRRKISPLPETGFTSAQWADAMRLYITHLLEPEDPAGIMLKYFQKQHDHALAREQRTQKTPVPLPSPTRQESMATGAAASAIVMGLGLLTMGVTYISQDNEVDRLYPMLSSANIEAANPTPKTPQYFDEAQAQATLAKVDYRRALERERSDILTGRVIKSPTTWVGGAAAGLGGFAAALFGAASIINHPVENIPARKRYEIVTGRTIRRSGKGNK